MTPLSRTPRGSRVVALLTTLAVTVTAFACTTSDNGSRAPGTTSASGSVAADDVAAPIPADARTGDAPSGMWSGTLPGTDAFVAIVSGPTELVAYVCDKGTLAEWFRTDGPGKNVQLTSPQGVRMVADLSAGPSGKATGTVTFPDRDPIEYTASPSSDAVLRRADARTESGTLLAGWIDVGSEQRGAIGVTPPAKPGPTTVVSSTTTTTAPAGSTPTVIVNRTVIAAPPINSTVRLVPLTTTTTAKASTTTTAPNATPITPPIPPVLVAPKIITPTGISTRTGNRPFFYLIAAAGDSYGSGEGAPVGTVPHGDDFEPTFPIPDGVWGPAANADEKQSREACHRSTNAGAPVAVLGKPAGDGSPGFQGLAQKYPNVPIKFIHVACSGAEIGNLVDQPYSGADRSIRPPGGNERPQLDQIRDFVGSGPIARFDSLIMSIGGNNSGFGAVVGGCITGGLLQYVSQAVKVSTGLSLPITVRDDPPGGDFDIVIGGTVVVPINKDLRFLIDTNSSCDKDLKLADQVATGGPDDTANTRGFDSLQTQYDRLGTAIRNMPVPPQQVLITEYADPSRRTAASTGPDCSGPAGKQAADILGLVDQDEAPWTIQTLLDPLNRNVLEASALNGWTPVIGHVGEFRQGHGVCSNAPFVNDNNAALARQGDDFRDDKLRGTLQSIESFLRGPIMTGIAAGIVAAGALTLDPQAVLAGIAIYQLANGPGQQLEKILSIAAGIMHPNAAGYEAYARAILPPLEQQFVATMTPENPGNFRQAGGTEGRSVLLRWDDLSDVETNYKLHADKISGDGPQTFDQRLPENATDFTHTVTTDATYRYTLQACNPQFCSDEVTTVGSSSKPKTAPAGLTAQFLDGLGRTSGGSTSPAMAVSWSGTNPNNATRWELDSTQTNPTPTTPQPKVLAAATPAARIEMGSSTSAFPRGQYTYAVRACNVFGCGPTSAPINASSADTAVRDIAVVNKFADLLPPSIFLDAGVTAPLPPKPGSGVDPNPGPTPSSSLPGP